MAVDNQEWLIRWPAPAKLNLMLNIVGRREDGYHLLQTVFQFVDWCDWLTFHSREDNALSLVKPTPGVPEQDDLTVRAAKLLQQHSGCQQGVAIEIDKNLPMGGGLGGGSSDAATTLVVLNRLWGLGLSVEQLMQLGLSLGADVPIFVFGASAWAEGVGERVDQISLPESWFVIIKPDCHVETRAIFCAKDLTRDSKPITIRDFLSGRQHNDCLKVVKKMHRPVADALLELSRFGEARLTGTGACVFAQYDSEVEALQVSRALQKRREWDVYMVRGLNRSSLHLKLDDLEL
jgi:4-diphosphocytidyl-2-C-methyl-D-erythritol kinase